MSVGAPTSYIPADDQQDKGRAFVSMSFTLTHRSEQAYLYDAGSSTLEIVSGGDRGVGIFDLALPQRSEISVVPGQSISWRQAYGVKSAKGITVKLALTGDEPPVTFSSDATATKGTPAPAGDVARFDPSSASRNLAAPTRSPVA